MINKDDLTPQRPRLETVINILLEINCTKDTNTTESHKVLSSMIVFYPNFGIFWAELRLFRE